VGGGSRITKRRLGLKGMGMGMGMGMGIGMAYWGDLVNNRC